MTFTGKPVASVPARGPEHLAEREEHDDHDDERHEHLSGDEFAQFLLEQDVEASHGRLTALSAATGSEAECRATWAKTCSRFSASYFALSSAGVPVSWMTPSAIMRDAIGQELDLEHVVTREQYRHAAFGEAIGPALEALWR